ncbi:MAG TPA: hypothetical protein P5142_06990 [Spirochaetia bacterium]|nr:hypothetical protein [Spirochaetia bacterium]
MRASLLAAAALGLASALLCSCVGAKAEASFEADGSGSLELQLLVSRMASPIASLSADRRILPVSYAREDFERAVTEIPGLSLSSYAREDRDEDISVRARVSFEDPAALAAFLDPSGKRAIYSEQGGRRSLRLVLAKGGAALDPDLARLVSLAFAAYRVDIALSFPPGPLAASLSPGADSGSSSVKGSRAEYANTTAALIESERAVEWEIVWGN